MSTSGQIATAVYNDKKTADFVCVIETNIAEQNHRYLLRGEFHEPCCGGGFVVPLLCAEVDGYPMRWAEPAKGQPIAAIEAVRTLEEADGLLKKWAYALVADVPQCDEVGQVAVAV